MYSFLIPVGWKYGPITEANRKANRNSVLEIYLVFKLVGKITVSIVN